MRILINSIIIACIVLLIVSCDYEYTPKPRGFFRIEMPAKEYIKLDSIFPYTFEYPVYAKISPDKRVKNEPYWINVDFPSFSGHLHISYKEIDNNLIDYLEDSRTLVMKHIQKASAINDEVIIDRERDLFGMVYYIEGIGTASPVQFFLTDSTQHFFRASLYYNIIPNNDSMAPVIEFMKQDIRHLINTFSWKE